MLEKNLRLATQTRLPVLLRGPTGTGKTTLARKIHDEGERRSGPFVTVNLASVHVGTLESTLFGHEKGAFTGADQRRVGKLELAQGGTLFLDEIAELSLPMQARLLEVLHSQQICRVGGNREIALNVRWMAATHQNLEELVEQGRFREDLYYRLRAIEIHLQALRASPRSLDTLVHEMLERISSEHGKKVLRLDPSAALAIENYAWPGNLRELHHALDVAVASMEGSTLQAEHLPEWIRSTSCSYAENPETHATSEYERAFREFRKTIVRSAMSDSQGKLRAAARSLGVPVSTFARWVRDFGEVAERH